MTQFSGVSLSIIIPAYNEEGRIGASLAAVLDWLAAGKHSTEVLVVDDGSTDATAAIVARLEETSPVRCCRCSPLTASRSTWSCSTRRSVRV